MANLQIIVATQNNGKLREIREVLKSLPVELFSLKDIGFNTNIIENKNSFKGNAILKAETVAKLTGRWALGDDSGLEVDALEGRPGIYSARYAGENATDHENNLKLLRELKEIPDSGRSAQFRCVLALSSPEKLIGTVEGSCLGKIGFIEQGTNGFGYDPLFTPTDYDQTFAQLDSSIKNRISHRAKALEKLQLLLESYLAKQ